MNSWKPRRRTCVCARKSSTKVCAAARKKRASSSSCRNKNRKSFLSKSSSARERIFFVSAFRHSEVIHADEADVVIKFAVEGEGTDDGEQFVEQNARRLGDEIFHVEREALLRIEFLVFAL